MDELIDIEKLFDGNAAKLAFNQIKSDGRHEQIITRNEQSDDDMYRSTNTSGGIVANSEQRYTPFGETRWTSGTLTTNRRFNGMKEESALGGTFGDFCEASPNEVSGAMRGCMIPRSGGS
jgi:hypothetical protein